MHLKIVTVEQTIVEAEVKALFTKSPEGEFEILNGHTPFMALTVPTPTEYITLEGTRETLFTSSGILKVLNNELLFMVDAAEKPGDIDVERARRALQRAQLKLESASPANKGSYLDAIARAKARLQAAR